MIQFPIGVESPGGLNSCLSVDPKLHNWDARKLSKKHAFKFNSRPTNPDASWKYGPEVVVIGLDTQKTECPLHHQIMLDTVTKGKEAGAFTLARPSLKIEENMKVGIMAYSCSGLLAESLQKNLSTAPSDAPYEPQKGDTFIMVGEITYVGSSHIEYRLNTVAGFSGAPVFQLTGNDEDEDHLKLIAIHAGWSNDLESNVGFLVADKVAAFEAGYWPKLWQVFCVVLMGLLCMTYVHQWSTDQH